VRTFNRDGSHVDAQSLAGKNVCRRSVQAEGLRAWVLEQGVTEIEMSERQFWNFAGLQPLAEKPWVTFMGRQLRVPNMPEDAQKCLGVYDPQRPGVI